MILLDVSTEEGHGLAPPCFPPIPCCQVRPHAQVQSGRRQQGNGVVAPERLSFEPVRTDFSTKKGDISKPMSFK